MKKINYIALLLCACLTSNGISAQENAVKLGISDFLYGGLHFNYEYVLSDNQSVALNVTTLIPRELPTFFFEEEVDDALEIINRVSGFAITPEYRFYTGNNGAPRGFYIAPYLRYSKYSVEFSDKVEGENYEVTGGVSTFGGGVQFGAQWLVSDAFVIDLYFLGLGADRHNVFIEYSSDDENTDYEQLANDIDEDLSDATIIGSRFSTEHGDDFVRVEAPFVYLGLRAGLSIGYAF
ncbi:MAG: hypothetical protein ACI8XB_001152 [Patiriisocius sp.]|jgi:hypothetical protein